MRLILILPIIACTENCSAKSFGGEMTVNLKCEEKLFDITWKEDSFWYATRPMRADDIAETYAFREKSSYGIVGGLVIVKECRTTRPPATLHMQG